MLASYCYSDVRDLTLSFAQRDMFKCWARPDEALPPPLLALNGERVDMKPLMHADRPVDLVQDAVTDCSVVASLCAASSRTEDGFGQVSALLLKFSCNGIINVADALHCHLAAKRQWRTYTFAERQVHSAAPV